MFLGKKHAYMQGLHCLLEVSSILSHSVHLESPTHSTFVCMCTSVVNRDAFNPFLSTLHFDTGLSLSLEHSDEAWLAGQ